MCWEKKRVKPKHGRKTILVTKLPFFLGISCFPRALKRETSILPILVSRKQQNWGWWILAKGMPFFVLLCRLQHVFILMSSGYHISRIWEIICTQHLPSKWGHLVNFEVHMPISHILIRLSKFTTKKKKIFSKLQFYYLFLIYSVTKI